VLNLAVLWGRVGTRYPKLDTVREEGVGGVVKFTFIVALDTPDGTIKLCGEISKKVRVGNVSDLWRNGKVHE
jgi:hypothetical protein